MSERRFVIHAAVRQHFGGVVDVAKQREDDVAAARRARAIFEAQRAGATVTSAAAPPMASERAHAAMPALTLRKASRVAPMPGVMVGHARSSLVVERGPGLMPAIRFGTAAPEVRAHETKHAIVPGRWMGTHYAMPGLPIGRAAR